MSKAITITVPNMEEAVKNCRTALDALGKNSGVALARAVNRSLEAVRTEATKIARSAYTARRDKLFDNIFVRRAGSQRPEGELELTGSKGISLIHFQARPALPGKRPKKGVSTKVRRDGPRRVRDVPGYTKPFILRKRQGGYGVFVRKVGGGFRDWGGLQSASGPILRLGATARKRFLRETGIPSLRGKAASPSTSCPPAIFRAAH